MSHMANLYITVEYASKDGTVQGIYHGFEVETAINHFEQLNEEKGPGTFVVLYQVDIDEDDLNDLNEDEEYGYVANLVYTDLTPENETYILRSGK